MTALLLAIGILSASAAQTESSAPLVDTISFDLGSRALGFHPTWSGPVGTVRLSRRLGGGAVGSRHVELAAGGYHQADFASEAMVDGGWSQRWMARWGGGLELGTTLTGQSSRVPGVVYVPDASGEFSAARAPHHFSAALGVHAGAGWQFRQNDRPIAVWTRYSQRAAFPFMPGNDVPVMGLTQLTAGVSVALRDGGPQ